MVDELDWTDMKLVTVPPTAGYFRLWPGMRIAAQKKPSGWRMFWMKKLLGWEWIDA